jgi:4,5-DOPA dioxygenase extradiol
VMIIGSGNIVHNLGKLNMQGKTAEWAVSFDDYIKKALESDDETALLDISRTGDSARLAVPTDEHYLPMLYIAAVKHADDNMLFLTDSFELGALSMRSVIYK